MRFLKHLCKLNKEVTNELCDNMGVEREQLFKLLNQEEFKRTVREAIEKEAKSFIGRRSFLEALALGAGITIGSMGLAKGEVLISNDNVIVKDPSTGLDWDLRVPLPFSAIVGIEGKKVRSYNWRGRLIDSGVAGQDDARAIQSAVDAVGQQGGGKVVIKRGEYLIDQKIYIPSNIIIEGTGYTVLKRTFDGNMINQSSGKNITIKDITFHGGGFSNIMHIWRTGCEYISYENVKFINSGQTTNTWDWGLSFYGANYCSFTGIVEGFSVGVVISNASTGCYINGIIRNSIYIDTACNGIIIDGYSTYNIINAIIENVAYRGMYIKGHNNIINVTIKRTGDFGLWLDEGKNNQIYTVIKEAGLNPPNTGGGIGIHQGKNNKIVADIEKCWYHGLVLGAHIEDIPVGTPAYVESNIIIVSSKNNNQSGEYRAGIMLCTGTKTDAYIRNNILILGDISDDQSTPTQYIGIWISGSGIIEENIFIGGRIYGNTYAALSVGGNNNIFENIHISGNVYIASGKHKFIRCSGYPTENQGIATITGNGTTTTFTVDVTHGLVTDDPTKIAVTITPSKPCDVSYAFVDTDGDGFAETLRITLTFGTAPANGEVVYISWRAEVVS